MANEIMTTIVSGIISVLGAIVSALSIYIVKRLKSWLQAKTNEKEYATISEFVNKAVNIVEAKYLGCTKKPESEKKKEEAVAIVKKMCAEKGITISDEMVNVIVDGTVAELNGVFDNVLETINQEYIGFKDKEENND